MLRKSFCCYPASEVAVDQAEAEAEKPWRGNWGSMANLKAIEALEHCLGSSTQSCPTLCDPVDYNPPGSSVHGISQAIILEWVPSPFLEIFPTQGSNLCLLHWQADSFTTPPGKPLRKQEAYSKVLGPTVYSQFLSFTPWVTLRQSLGPEHRTRSRGHLWSQNYCNISWFWVTGISWFWPFPATCKMCPDSIFPSTDPCWGLLTSRVRPVTHQSRRGRGRMQGWGGGQIQTESSGGHWPSLKS